MDKLYRYLVVLWGQKLLKIIKRHSSFWTKGSNYPQMYIVNTALSAAAALYYCKIHTAQIRSSSICVTSSVSHTERWYNRSSKDHQVSPVILNKPSDCAECETDRRAGLIISYTKQGYCNDYMGNRPAPLPTTPPPTERWRGFWLIPSQ